MCPPPGSGASPGVSTPANNGGGGGGTNNNNNNNNNNNSVGVRGGGGGAPPGGPRLWPPSAFAQMYAHTSVWLARTFAQTHKLAGIVRVIKTKMQDNAKTYVSVAALALLLAYFRLVTIISWALQATFLLAVFVPLLASKLLAPVAAHRTTLLENADALARADETRRRHKATCDATPQASSCKTEQRTLRLDALRRFLPMPSAESSGQLSYFLTGATGFVGTCVLREILLHTDAAVTVLVRPKRGVSAAERLTALLNDAALADVPQQRRGDVKPLAGDATQPDFGLDEHDARALQSEMFTHVLHCAADVSFAMDLAEAARANITSSLQVQEYARHWRATMVYTSTAFVHGGACGSERAPLPCELFELSGGADPEQIYHSMLGSGALAAKVMRRLGFPNSYAFSKCVAEHLLLRDHATDVRIVRPAIVGPSWASPWPSWAGSKPSTLVAGGVLYLARRSSAWSLGPTNIPVIPVDVVARAVVACSLDSREHAPRVFTAAWPSGCAPEDKNAKQLQKQTLWCDWARAVIQLGTLRNLVPFGRMHALLLHALGTEMVSRVRWTHGGFATLHRVLNRAPTELALRVLRRIRPKQAEQLAGALKLLDLPLLFHPFTARNFVFESSLSHRKLDGFDGEEYLAACCIAAIDSFLADPPRNLGLARADVRDWRSHELTPAQDSLCTMWRSMRTTLNAFAWSISQPLGNAAHRALGFALTLLFASLGMKLTVDVASFAEMARHLRRRCDGDASLSARPPVVVLAPTHRSVLDFLVVSYITFAIPELGLAMPHIAAAEEFGTLPVLGWLARAAGAFFVKRQGGGRADDGLAAHVSSLKARYRATRAADPPLTLEVFVEGTRSRDRRFGVPKKGFLRMLQDTGGEHVVVPLSISYERTPEQARFVGSGSGSAGIHLSTLLSALAAHMGLSHVAIRMLALARGKRSTTSTSTSMPTTSTRVGRVHVTAGCPVPLRVSDNAADVATAVVHEQMKLVHATSYHTSATAMCLGMPPSEVHLALRACGVPFLEESGENDTIARWNPTPPRAGAELEAVSLHCLHFVAPHLLSKQAVESFAREGSCVGNNAVGEAAARRWHAWLTAGVTPSDESIITAVSEMDESMKNARDRLRDRLIARMASADAAAADAVKHLASLGVPHPSAEHVLRHVPKSNAHGPMAFAAATAAAAAVSAEGDCKTHARSSPKYGSGNAGGGAVRPVFSRSATGVNGNASPVFSHRTEAEAFGAWGFLDSRFVLRSTSEHANGAVVLLGDRYELCGRAMPDLVDFFERQLDVAGLADRKPLPEADATAPPIVPPSDLKESDIEALRLTLGDDRAVSTDSACRCRHGTGHSQEDVMALRGSRPMPRVPDAVVWPSSEKHAESLCTLAVEHGWCLIPFGGGTNVTHALWCPPKDVDNRPMVCVDMRHMCTVHWVNKDDGLARVDAGIVGRHLVEKLRAHGMTLGHEPDSLEFSTLGGWVATRASGMKRARYGNIEDIVRSVRMITPRGILWQHHDYHGVDKTAQTAFGRTSSGLELAQLALGSEGCLGLITSVVIKVRPLPECEECDAVVFPDWGTGLRFCRALARCAIRPVSTRLVDNEQFRLGAVLRGDATRSLTGWMKHVLSRGMLAARGIDTSRAVAATLLFEGSRAEVAAQRASARAAASGLGGLFAGEATGRAGYNLTFAIAYLRDFALSHHVLGESFETFVPWSLMKECVARVRRRIAAVHAKRGLPGTPLVSARVTQLYDDGGCVYFYLATCIAGVGEPSTAFAELEHEAREEVLASGGSLSHHHGVGKLRADFAVRSSSGVLCDAVKKLKEAVDPENVFGVRNGLYT
ncbi:alkyldihydroxyacetonephosphate synthase [Pycnococcus provasolii]